MLKKATVLWTGGKDSALALYKAKNLGIEITNLCTFTPNDAKFKSHPIKFMSLQAEALGIPHYILNIEEPYDISYEEQLNYLIENTGISMIISGDISEIGDYPNWIIERCRSLNCEPFLPLWHSNRLELLETLLINKFEIIFSYVKEPWFTKQWAGKKINSKTLKELISLTQVYNLDLCGEQGEYHTLVLDMPDFEKKITISNYSVISSNSLHYIDLKDFELKDK
ncbi:MAG: diphthine--ammonia ligase [Candidatus Odinarchaeota archaeon]